MITKSVKMAFSAIKQSKMRSFLTMLGIIIGVIAVVVLVSITSSSTQSVTAEFQNMGANLLSVSISNSRTKTFAMSDLEELVDEAENIDAAAPTITQSSTVKAGSTSESGTIIGTTPSYWDINNTETAAGRAIMTPDVQNNSNVAVIGQEIASDLFGTLDVVGENISIDGRAFTIVGVLEDAGSTLTGSDNTSIFIPYSVAQRMYSVSGVTSFTIASTGSETVDDAEAEVTQKLTSLFGEDAFSVRNQASMLESLSSVTNTLSLMLGGIAAISLLVGGIGIMNIMLVSVTERTREIGIRKAIGAGRKAILMQFLIEALVLSALGGLIGIGVSWLTLFALSRILDTTYQMSSRVALLAVGFTLVIGLAFGISPANKAARMSPIDALRTE